MEVAAVTPLEQVEWILDGYEPHRVQRWLHHSSIRLGSEPIALLFNGGADDVLVEARAIAAGTVALDHLDVLAVVGEQQ